MTPGIRFTQRTVKSDFSIYEDGIRLGNYEIQCKIGAAAFPAKQFQWRHQGRSVIRSWQWRQEFSVIISAHSIHLWGLFYTPCTDPLCIAPAASSLHEEKCTYSHIFVVIGVITFRNTFRFVPITSSFTGVEDHGNWFWLRILNLRVLWWFWH